MRLAAVSSVILMAISPLVASAQQSGFFPRSTPFQQQAGNFVAVPVGTNTELRTQLPQVFIGNTPVPTDATGIGGSLGRAQGLRERILGPDRNTLPDSHGFIVARDPRYNFTGIWNAFYPTGVSVLPGVRTYSAVMAPSAMPVLSRSAFRMNSDDIAPQFMPSGTAKYTVIGGNRLSLQDGAVLIKTGRTPVLVGASVNGETASVKLDGGALVLVSMMCGRLNVMNLTDNHRDSTVVYLTDKTRGDYGWTPVRIGNMVEIYPNALGRAENELVAYTVLNKIPMTNGLTVETLRFSYPRAMKRFNITRSLPGDDFARVTKSAVAVSYIDREREWNDLAIYAP
jgi:hypothetical protein